MRLDSRLPDLTHFFKEENENLEIPEILETPAFVNKLNSIMEGTNFSKKDLEYLQNLNGELFEQFISQYAESLLENFTIDNWLDNPRVSDIKKIIICSCMANGLIERDLEEIPSKFVIDISALQATVYGNRLRVDNDYHSAIQIVKNQVVQHTDLEKTKLLNSIGRYNNSNEQKPELLANFLQKLNYFRVVDFGLIQDYLLKLQRLNSNSDTLQKLNDKFSGLNKKHLELKENINIFTDANLIEAMTLDNEILKLMKDCLIEIKNN